MSAAAAATKMDAESAPPAAATPSLEDTLASFAAVSPVEGRLLTDKIAAIKANEEKSVAELEKLRKELEEARRRSVDNEVLKQQLTQFQNAMGPPTMQRYGMNDIEQVMKELTSRNGDVVGNAASRLIAACNSKFMSMAPAAAPAAAATPTSKRKREPEAAPVVEAAGAATADVASQDLLRRALAASYD